jgi:hypothetical protein
MLRSCLLALAFCGATAFHVGAPAHVVQRLATSSSSIVMVQKEASEKKGLFSFMSKDTEGKVVPTNKGKDEEMSEGKQLMQKVKDAGTAGIISYIFWEWAFWGVSVPVALFGFKAATGEFPDFQNSDDMAKLGAEAFAFVNVARFAVPLRIGLALGTTPWVQSNIVDKFQKKD